MLGGVDEPRWLADEMLGRLARYLRFLGHDTAYARDRADAEIADWARREHRVLLTRDRELAGRVAGALLLTTPTLAEQLRAVRLAFPRYRYELAFDRCSQCNGPLHPCEVPEPGPATHGVPLDRVRAGLALYRCGGCGKYYWEGSHTAGIRRRLADIFGGG